MGLADYKKLSKILNDKLKKYGRQEEFEIASVTEDGAVYHSLIMNNRVSEMLSIELVYDGEWTVYFLGTHDHLYYYVLNPNDEKFAEEIVKRIVIPILENRIVHVYYSENGEWRGSRIEAVPEDIPFEFDEKELPDSHTCNVLCWQGEVTDPKIRAYAVSERKEVEDLKGELYAEFFEYDF